MCQLVGQVRRSSLQMLVDESLAALSGELEQRSGAGTLALADGPTPVAKRVGSEMADLVTLRDQHAAGSVDKRMKPGGRVLRAVQISAGNSQSCLNPGST